MAEYEQYLAILDFDPRDEQALSALESLGNGELCTPEAVAALDNTRRNLLERGELDVVARLFDVEIKATTNDGRLADLLMAKGHLYADDLLNEQRAVECFRRVLDLRPNDEDAQEVLAHLDLVRDNWKRIVEKYIDEANVSTDQQLTTSLFLSAAETHARYEPGAAEVEQCLRRALDVEPRNRRAATHLERLLRKAARWDALAELLEERIQVGATKDDRVQALLALADLAQSRLDRPELAIDTMKRLIAVEPAHPRAMQLLSDLYERTEDWHALVMLYTNALKARRRSIARDPETGMLLQIAMLHWRRLDDRDAAEEYFRRIRKLEPAHPAALDFYRDYCASRGELGKLVQILRQAHKAAADEEARSALSMEIANLSEHELGNPDKAIDSWKGILRRDPKNYEARDALKRLYRATEKWNALLDLMKDEVERLPADDTDQRVEGLLEIVEIYRDRLKLDVMVINTYNTILQIEPTNVAALDALAEKYQQLGRWNDLIAVWTRKAGLEDTPRTERAELLRAIATLWAERFGNFAQAIKPLEELLEIEPSDADALARLRDIYTRRRQWRPLIALLERQVHALPLEARRPQLVEMARLASDRLGDPELAIEIWNQVLALDEDGPHADPEALAALAVLYERGKRWLALAEILSRQCECHDPNDRATLIANLERLGAIFADKLAAPQHAMGPLRAILEIEPNHPKALRSLRQLHAAAGDSRALEELYGGLGQWDELVDALSSMADRAGSREQQLHLLIRAAEIAGEHVTNLDKVARAYERVQAIEAKHAGAARALVPVYTQTHKWARLLSTYEVLLEHAVEHSERVRLHVDIRNLCEERLGSKALAFQWTARAYELQPDDPELLHDMQRLAADADAWEEVSRVLEGRATSAGVSEDEQLQLYRQLGTIAAVRLHRPDDARRFQERVLELAPDDPLAMDALEKLHTEQGRWADLLVIYRRRAQLADSDDERLALLFKIAFIEEDRLGDLDAAAATYTQVLDIDGGSQRALKALEKVQEARGDAEGLAAALERELGLASETDVRVNLLLRLGELYEAHLGRRGDALRGYTEALSLAPNKSQVHSALERFLVATNEGEEDSRIEVARMLLPVYEHSSDPAKEARVLEILRGASEPAERLALDRRLVRLFSGRLGDAQRAYAAASRVLEQAPADAENRRLLFDFAARHDALEDLAIQLASVLEQADERELDAETQRVIASEVASLYGERLMQPARAEAAWRRVLDIDPTDQHAYEVLDRIYRGTESWSDLRALLLRREENALDGAARKDILLSICDLDEGVLDNAEGAIESYRRVLAIDPSAPRAYRALERLLGEQQAWSELEALLAQELAQLDPDQHSHLEHWVAVTCRRALLRMERLDDPEGAVDLFEEVISRMPEHPDARRGLEQLLSSPGQRLRVARLLAPLYEDEGMWRDLCSALRAQREFAGSPAEAVDLLARVATIEVERLGDIEGAFASWSEALRTDASDQRPREALQELSGELGAWQAAAESWEEALANAADDDVALSGGLLAELAIIYDRRIGDGEKAASAYRRLLEIDPGNIDLVRQAGEALDRLYSEQEKWPELVEIVRRRAEWADSGDTRRQFLARVAQLSEEMLGDVDSAVATWRDVLTEDPEDLRALDALERIYVQREAAPELIEVLRRRVDLVAEPLDKKQLLRRVAALFELSVGDEHEAIVALLEVLDYVPDDRETLDELARLYRSGKRYIDLLDVTERRLQLSEDPHARIALICEVADLLHNYLDRHAEALERYAEVLSFNPRHIAALSATEALLENPGLRRRAAEVLQPIYEAAAEYGKLAALLERLAEAVDDPRERLRAMRWVAELREYRLGDAAGAFDACELALRDAVGEPDLAELVAELQRLASEQERMPDLIRVFREIAPDVLDSELQRQLYLDIADLARAVLKDIDIAREYYQLVMDARPDDRRAMAALEDIYRAGEEFERLHDILARKAELNAESDIEARVDALAEAARLCVKHLGRKDDAIMYWEQVLEVAPDNREAADTLEQLYQQTERWHDLADLLQRRLGFAFAVPEAVALQFRLGSLYERQLNDPDAAVEAYSATLGGDPNHDQATAALERFLDDPGTRSAAASILEPTYVSHQNWPKLVRIYEIKLDAAEDPRERLKLTRYIARLYEEQLEDLEEAFRWYGRVFREAPGDAAVRDQLSRLATILGNWASFANIYQEYLDDETGDSEAVRVVALSLAEIYDRRLDEIEKGQVAYRRVLQSTPDDAGTFARLEAMLNRGERWYALVDCYEEAIGVTLDDRWRCDLYKRLAAVQEQHLQDIDRAIDAYRTVLDIRPDDPEATAHLERLFAAENKWFDLAELTSARISRCDEPADAVQLRLRYADLLEHRLDDIQGAIDQYEMVLGGGGQGQEHALAALERLVQNRDYQERIALLLEPVYRRNDWWQKLVVLLHDARLPFVDDRVERVAMLREIAHLHESRGGDEHLALNAVARAWREDISQTEVFDELFALAAKLGEWGELIAALEQGIDGNYDFEVVARVLVRIAELEESRRHDKDRAIGAWRRLLEIRDEDDQALRNLDRLLEAERRFHEQVQIIERRAELADSDEQRKLFLHRVAKLQEEALGSIPDAIQTWRSALTLDDADSEALDALERLYRTTADFTELSLILSRKIELAESPQARRGLHLAAATVNDEELNDPYEAIAHLRAILDSVPDDLEALARLDQLYLREKMYGELLQIVDRRAEVDHTGRVEHCFRAAELIEKELLEPENAIGRYAAVLDLDPSHEGARAALDRMTRDEDTLMMAADVLDRVYRAEGASDALADLYERKIRGLAGDPDARRLQYAALAEVHENGRSDVEAAFAVWSRALADMPEDQSIQQELERLAASTGGWEQLTALYERQLADIVDSELEYAYAARLSRIYEEALGDLDRAAASLRKALAVTANEGEVLAALDRIYEGAGRWSELAEVLARRADATVDEHEQCELLYRLGDVRERHLQDPAAAVTSYRDVLERNPSHSAARYALERLLSCESERAEVIAVLEPIYESDGDYARLAELLGAKISIVGDQFERAQLYARIADICEQQLGDPVRALDATGGWLAEDPQSEEALSRLERLAETVQRWGEVAARLSGIVESTQDREVRLPLALRLGQIWLARLGDDVRAEETLRAVLELDSEHEEALRSLEGIYRDRADVSRLVEVLARRAALLYDAIAKRALLAEVAQLCEQSGDLVRAETIWKEVIELDESDRGALDRLAALYEGQQRWPDLVDVLAATARFARDVQDEISLRTQIATLQTGPLENLDAAVIGWQAIIDLDPTDLRALSELEKVHVAREDWLAVQETVTRRLDLIDDDGERVAVLRRLAELSETKRNSVDEAIGYLMQIFDIDPTDEVGFGQLERLLGSAERWHDLVELLQRAADGMAKSGNTAGEIGYLARAADVWEGPLENPDAAGEILEVILGKDANYVPAFNRLARLYEAQSEWDKCAEILQRALALRPTGRDAADIHHRLGEVARRKNDDDTAALEHFYEALRHDGNHPGAVAAVEEIARACEDWQLVADMLSRREQSMTDEDGRLAVVIELADIYARKLGEPAAVIPMLERAYASAGDDARVAGLLADLYFAAGRYPEAQVIYERLADAAKAKRRMKEVATYRQRIGAIAEMTGQMDTALAAYEDAFRVNPTDVLTMAGLGRIYMLKQDWEKARRVYRSMVLQNMDPELGISKADVYLALGDIHVQLGEAMKAKGMYQRGLEIEPDNSNLKQALAAL
jgi:golgin subfamily B member 1